MIDLLLMLFVAAFGAIMRLPFFAMLPARFEDGLPMGDMSAIQDQLSLNRSRAWPSDHKLRSTHFEGIFGYPVLFHWFVSKFPPKRWRIASVLLSTLPDVTLSVVIYWLLRAGWSSPLQSGGFAGVDAPTAALAALVFLTQPGLIPTTARLKATNGRTVGLLFFSLFLAAAFVAYQSEHWDAWYFASIAVMAVSIYLIVMSSLFSSQTILFVGLPLGIVLPSVAILVTIVATFALIYLLPILGARDVIRWKLAHFFWYRRNRATIGAVENRRVFATFLAFWPALFNNPARAKRIFLNDSPLLMALVGYPGIVGIVAGLTANGFAIPNDFVWLAASLFIATLPIFFLTAGPLLSELGQAERYWDYSSAVLIPASVALISIAADQPTVSAILLLTVLFQGAIVVVTHIYLNGRTWRLVHSFPAETDEIQVVDYFRRAGIEPRLATLPQQMQQYWPRLFRERGLECVTFSYLLFEDGAPLKAGFPYMERFFREDIQVPSMSAPEFAERAKVDHVIALRGHFQATAARPFVRELTESYDPVFENRKYLVFDLRKRRGQ
jgi:hypothetical protein